MIKMSNLAAAVALLIGTPAYATPVSLICSLIDHDGPSIFDIQLNETAGTVTYVIRRGGVVVSKPARFTPQTVFFNSFEIDRSTLAFIRNNDPEYVKMFNYAPVDRGTCELSVIERAF